jgi:Glycosyl hydrolase family 3 C-terminal domain/Carbohydrate binding module (family 6)/Secretion system C-terminal sorting domain
MLIILDCSAADGQFSGKGLSGNITEGTTILDGLKKVAPNVEFIYDAEGNFNDNVADYAIVVVGEQPYAEGQGDKDDLSLIRSQVQLVRKLKKMGLPVITILITGRPMIINSVLHNSDALFVSWLPGTEGDGIAEVLFGYHEPTGKLPMTWQKSMGQIPQNFGDQNYVPLFPYDFGINSYENSEVGSAPVLNSALLTEDGIHIELSFNKSMNYSGNTQAEISVALDNSLPVEITNFELSTISDNVILLELSQAFDQNANLTVSYLSGNITSEDGGVLNLFNDVAVINFKKYGASLHSLPGRIEAEDFVDMFGVQTENTDDFGGGLNVGWIDDGDWLEYECELQTTGSYFGVFRVASESSGGTIKFYVDDIEKFTSTVPVTGGWQSWTNISNFVDLEKGTSTIRLLSEKGGFNLNWFEFSTITNANSAQTVIPEFSLSQNYPNPFNPSTNIEYVIDKRGLVRLSVFDILGREINVLVNKTQNQGMYSVRFDASELPSGVYYYSLKSGNHAQSKKLLLIK